MCQKKKQQKKKTVVQLLTKIKCLCILLQGGPIEVISEGLDG